MANTATLEIDVLIHVENEIAKDLEFIRVAKFKLRDAERCCRADAIAYWAERIARLEGAVSALEPVKKLLMKD